MFSDELQAPRFITQPSASGSIVAVGRTKILQCQALGEFTISAIFFSFSLWLISSSILKFLKQYQFRFPQSQLLPWTCHMALRVPLVVESLLLLFYCCLSFLIVLLPPQASPSPSTAGCGTETSSPSSPRSIFTRSRASREVTRGVTSASPGTAWAASSVRWSPSPSPVSRIS